ncbi:MULTISPECIES: glycosyltransferase family 4 protein [unclassified Lentimicrobium]|uniref:glycosyltransferase family 4 protein n=1 Tax=unclassified Lentimicrobium TaxID=2677434 RepID=UPI0015559389|nr:MULTISPECIES: glycosyltransferase family 4 protein [unclassified Lentimicrobium]NPD45853.1 glycosyltransferase family 4 protein [Lentimicrobium sp. S6]NPD86560.1 glycosyltransferase family 4 protein [Lentimicrobium sp. L6]
MKIVNIVPGFGGTFYCGNCLRDSGYTKSLIKLGHDAMMLPIYLPLTMEHGVEENTAPIFYGAVNIYLKQNFKIFRKMPNWMEKLFNSSSMLRYAAKKAGSTRTEGLEPMTISMLQGKDGNQGEDLQELIDFLKVHEKPDVVHLSNALLLGLAKQIREQLNVPVVCSLQDEDVWVDAMNDHYKKIVWDLMSEKGEDVDAFIAVSDYYAQEMKQKMRIPDSKMHIVPIGVEADLYKYAKPLKEPQTIGYISRMYEEHGFGLLIDAYIELKKDEQFKHVLLKLSGGYTADDKKYVGKQMKKLKKAGIFEDVMIIEDYQAESRFKFFNQLTLLTVPVLKGEAFGTYQLESMAAGIPLVQPALGAFPEIIKQTGGGVVYSPNTVEALVAKWKEVLSNPEGIERMSEMGSQAVREKYAIDPVSEQVLKIYESLV